MADTTFILSDEEFQNLEKGFYNQVKPYLAARLEEYRISRSSDRFLEELVAGLEPVMKVLKSTKEAIRQGEQTIADLEAKKIQLQASLAPLKAQVAEDERALKVLKAQRVRDLAELERQVEVKQQKLAALEGAISERATELGGLIAKELS